MRRNPSSDPVKRYTSSHWGIAPTRKWTVDVPGEGRQAVLVEMGKLVAIHVDGKVLLDWDDYDDNCVLAFDANKRQRLFLLIPPRYRDQIKRKLVERDGEWLQLGDAAHEAGGRQARFPSPRVEVQIVGVCTDVVYFTEKKGDGESEYIHALGEETGVKPFLCVDRHGQLYLAGGNYSCPDAGITD